MGVNLMNYSSDWCMSICARDICVCTVLYFYFFLCFPFFSFFFKMHSNDINFYIIESRKTWHNMQLRVLSSIETEIKLSWISFLKTAQLIFFFQFIFVKYNKLFNFLSFDMNKLSLLAKLENNVGTFLKTIPTPYLLSALQKKKSYKTFIQKIW